RRHRAPDLRPPHPPLCREGSRERELCSADLRHVVAASAEEAQRLEGEPFGLLGCSLCDEILRERRARVAGLHAEVELEEDLERLPKEIDRALTVSDQVVEA